MSPNTQAGRDTARAGPAAEPLVGLCLRWLRLTGRLNLQQDRWSRLEKRLVREHSWFQLSDDERDASPFAVDFRKIEARMEQLQAARNGLLREITAQSATGVPGAHARLVVVERMIWPFENPELHAMLASALQDVEALFPEVRDQSFYRAAERYRSR